MAMRKFRRAIAPNFYPLGQNDGKLNQAASPNPRISASSALSVFYHYHRRSGKWNADDTDDADFHGL